MANIDGLNQSFTNADSKTVHMLSDVLTESDYWELKKRGSKSLILTHSAIQKIADLAGIDKHVKYDVIISPNYQNNYQLSINATIKYGDTLVNEIGEVNRSNLTSRGKHNPTNMAQKRAYDRAVMRALGIRGLLSEEELTSAEDDKDMENLTVDQQKKVAKYVSKVILAKTTKDLAAVKTMIVAAKSELLLDELNYLRKIYKKKLAELSKSF